MKIITALLFLLFIRTSFTQVESIGVGIGLGDGIKYLSVDLGAEIFMDFKIDDIYVIRLDYSLIYSEFSDENPYLFTNTYNHSAIEAILIYRPSNDKVRAYAGVGAGYYSLSTEIQGNPYLYEDNYLTGHEIDNAMGMCIIAGFKFSANSFFSPFLEVKSTIIPTHYKATLYNFTSNSRSYFEENITIISMILKAGFSINF